MTNGGLQDRRNEAEVKESRIKIKNAIRIIDFRIENCLEQKREMVRAKFNPEVLEMGNSLMEKMVKNFQEIRDELRPEEKSI